MGQSLENFSVEILIEFWIQLKNSGSCSCVEASTFPIGNRIISSFLLKSSLKIPKETCPKEVGFKGRLKANLDTT